MTKQEIQKYTKKVLNLWLRGTTRDHEEALKAGDKQCELIYACESSVVENIMVALKPIWEDMEK